MKHIFHILYSQVYEAIPCACTSRPSVDATFKVLFDALKVALYPKLVSVYQRALNPFHIESAANNLQTAKILESNNDF